MATGAGRTLGAGRTPHTSLDPPRQGGSRMSYLGTRFARSRSLTLAAVLLSALGVLAVFVARAEALPLPATNFPLPGSNFQGGDGNQANPPAPAGATNPAPFPATYDWQHVAGSTTTFPDP